LEAGIEPTTFQAPPYVCYGKARALPTELPPPVRDPQVVTPTGVASDFCLHPNGKQQPIYLEESSSGGHASFMKTLTLFSDSPQPPTLTAEVSRFS
jgi:hypothetical protein